MDSATGSRAQGRCRLHGPVRLSKERSDCTAPVWIYRYKGRGAAGGESGVEFRGYGIDAEAARLTLEYLEGAVEHALGARRRAGGFPAGRSAAYDYRIGFASEVHARVVVIVAERAAAERATSGTGTALAVRKREIVERECGAGLRTARSRHRGPRDAAAAGRTDGSRVSLDPQVRGSAAPERLGTG